MVQRGEIGVREDGHIGADGGGHPAHFQLVESAEGSGNGGGPVSAPADQLAHKIVVERADLVAGLVATVPAGAVAAGHSHPGDRPRRRQKGPFGGVFRVDSHFYGVAGELDVVLGEGQGFAGGNLDLLFHQVDPGNQLGGRVLHLESGVHLQVVEVAVLVEELHRAGVHIIAA